MGAGDVIEICRTVPKFCGVFLTSQLIVNHHHAGLKNWCRHDQKLKLSVRKEFR